MANPKIKISIVSYLNSKPFILALDSAELNDEIEISLDIPSDCASKLLDGRVDIGLVPVTIIPKLSKARIISDYCIAADGKVGSVLLLSNVPMSEIQGIYLDYQSRTSVQLVRILADKLWKIKPEWLSTDPGYEKQILGKTAGVIIGDRALVEKNKFLYVYDLAEDWKKLTGLPFVFACWIANKDIDVQVLKKLNTALSNTLNFIPEVVAMHAEYGISKKDTEIYFAENIQYFLNDKKREGLDLFLKYLCEVKQD